jgi:hypothetical protein
VTIPIVAPTSSFACRTGGILSKLPGFADTELMSVWSTAPTSQFGEFLGVRHKDADLGDGVGAVATGIDPAPLGCDPIGRRGARWLLWRLNNQRDRAFLQGIPEYLNVGYPIRGLVSRAPGAA